MQNLLKLENLLTIEKEMSPINILGIFTLPRENDGVKSYQSIIIGFTSLEDYIFNKNRDTILSSDEFEVFGPEFLINEVENLVINKSDKEIFKRTSILNPKFDLLSTYFENIDDINLLKEVIVKSIIQIDNLCKDLIIEVPLTYLEFLEKITLNEEKALKTIMPFIDKKTGEGSIVIKNIHNENTPSKEVYKNLLNKMKSNRIITVDRTKYCLKLKFINKSVLESLK